MTSAVVKFVAQPEGLVVPFNDVITSQPKPVPSPPTPAYHLLEQDVTSAGSCPLGLQYLMGLDQLLVHQKVELLEVLTEIETCNKYVVKNSMGQEAYFAKEKSGCCNRMCCGSLRSFDMEIRDNFQHEVLHFSRPLACQQCCFPCCLQMLEVSSPPGTIIGTVEQTWGILRTYFDVKDAAGNVVLKIVGPVCNCDLCCNDVVYKIYSADMSNVVGNITKQWAGCCKESLTDADNFSVTFSMQLDVKIKAVLLGALFLIDFMHFETKKDSGGELLCDLLFWAV